jgi:hypothetical protein
MSCLLIFSAVYSSRRSCALESGERFVRVYTAVPVAYGPNAGRLLRLKERYDPKGVFRAISLR